MVTSTTLAAWRMEALEYLTLSAGKITPDNREVWVLQRRVETLLYSLASAEEKIAELEMEIAHRDAMEENIERGRRYVITRKVISEPGAGITIEELNITDRFTQTEDAK